MDARQPFVWHVSPTGYQWVEARTFEKGPGRFGMDGLDSANFKTLKSIVHQISEQEPQPFLFDEHEYLQRSGRQYEPLREFTGLFRDFAAIEPSQDAVAAFANQFGLLGGDIRTAIVPPWEKADFVGLALYGEPELLWHWELNALRVCLDLHGAITAGDTEKLKQRIVWQSGEPLFRFRAPERAPIGILDTIRRVDGLAAIDMSSKERALYEHDNELVGPGLAYLRNVINKHIRGRVAPQFVPNEDGALSMRMDVKPNCLIGAIWLQFAMAIEHGHGFRECTECGTWFVVSAGHGRPDKLYCSDACRMRAYRRRKTAKLNNKQRG